jgi:VNT family MFS transporter (synaptic vesicle glycoprotein 2)
MTKQSSSNNLSSRSDIDLRENVNNNSNNNNNYNYNGSENDNIYEECLSMIGFGKFQILLLIVCGMANASDAIEILCVSFVLPTAQCELKMSSVGCF